MADNEVGFDLDLTGEDGFRSEVDADIKTSGEKHPFLDPKASLNVHQWVKKPMLASASNNYLRVNYGRDSNATKDAATISTLMSVGMWPTLLANGISHLAFGHALPYYFESCLNNRHVSEALDDATKIFEYFVNTKDPGSLFFCSAVMLTAFSSFFNEFSKAMHSGSLDEQFAAAHFESIFKQLGPEAAEFAQSEIGQANFDYVLKAMNEAIVVQNEDKMSPKVTRYHLMNSLEKIMVAASKEGDCVWPCMLVHDGEGGKISLDLTNALDLAKAVEMVGIPLSQNVLKNIPPSELNYDSIPIVDKAKRETLQNVLDQANMTADDFVKMIKSFGVVQREEDLENIQNSFGSGDADKAFQEIDSLADGGDLLAFATLEMVNRLEQLKSSYDNTKEASDLRFGVPKSGEKQDIKQIRGERYLRMQMRAVGKHLTGAPHISELFERFVDGQITSKDLAKNIIESLQEKHKGCVKGEKAKIALITQEINRVNSHIDHPYKTSVMHFVSERRGMKGGVEKAIGRLEAALHYEPNQDLIFSNTVKETGEILFEKPTGRSKDDRGINREAPPPISFGGDVGDGGSIAPTPTPTPTPPTSHNLGK